MIILVNCRQSVRGLFDNNCGHNCYNSFDNTKIIIHEYRGLDSSETPQGCGTAQETPRNPCGTMCMSEATSADEAAGVASDASVESAQETPTATTDPPANVSQNGRNGPGDMYLALKRMTHGVTWGYRGPRRV